MEGVRDGLAERRRVAFHVLSSAGLSAMLTVFFFSSRRRHTIFDCDWSSDVCSSDLVPSYIPATCDQAPAAIGAREMTVLPEAKTTAISMFPLWTPRENEVWFPRRLMTMGWLPLTMEGCTQAATAIRFVTVNCGSSGTWTRSLTLRIATPRPLIPGTQAAFRACCALAPSPEESARKWEVGEQSSKCHWPNADAPGPPSVNAPPSSPIGPPPLLLLALPLLLLTPLLLPPKPPPLPIGPLLLPTPTPPSMAPVGPMRIV